MTDAFSSTDGCNEHDAFENNIVLCKAIHEVVMDELNEVGFLDDDFPMVRGDVNHRSQELKHQVGVFSTLLDHHGVVLEVLDESVIAIWVELSDVTDAFEQQSVAEFRGTGDHLIELTVYSEHLSVSLVRSEVDSESNELLADDWLRAVNY